MLQFTVSFTLLTHSFSLTLVQPWGGHFSIFSLHFSIWFLTWNTLEICVKQNLKQLKSNHWNVFSVKCGTNVFNENLGINRSFCSYWQHYFESKVLTRKDAKYLFPVTLPHISTIFFFSFCQKHTLTLLSLIRPGYPEVIRKLIPSVSKSYLIVYSLP